MRHCSGVGRRLGGMPTCVLLPRWHTSPRCRLLLLQPTKERLRYLLRYGRPPTHPPMQNVPCLLLTLQYIALTPEGDLLVSDAENTRVQRCGPAAPVAAASAGCGCRRSAGRCRSTRAEPSSVYGGMHALFPSLASFINQPTAVPPRLPSCPWPAFSSGCARAALPWRPLAAKATPTVASCCPRGWLCWATAARCWWPTASAARCRPSRLRCEPGLF